MAFKVSENNCGTGKAFVGKKVTCQMMLQDDVRILVDQWPVTPN